MPDPTLAPPPPAAPSLAPWVKRHSNQETIALDPALELGVGGEAYVYALPGDGALVAKLYRDPTLERARKLTRMIENPPALPEGGAAALAWPADLLSDARGRFVGFLMPFAAGARVFELYNPVTRRREAPLFHWGLLHRAGANVAAAFEALHARGYVVGDVNESNFLVSPAGAVTVVDTDSFQVRDAQGGLHRSPVGKAEFTPPELQGVSFADVDRGPEHDRFGLAVLLFLLLMEGTHPFAARFEGSGEAPPVEERIRRGFFPHADGAEVRPPRMAPAFATLHPELRALFVTAFVDGHADPAVRPSAAEWQAALEGAEAALATCPANGQHRYGAHLGALCPWCHRTRILRGRDPFPATAEEALRTDAAPVSARMPRRVPDLMPVLPVAAPAPAPAVQPKAPPPVLAPPPYGLAVLGQAGVQHPAAWLLPMLVLMSAAGMATLQLAGAVGVVVSVSRLWRRGGIGPVRPVTVFVTLLLALLAGLVSAGTYPMQAFDPYAHTTPRYPEVRYEDPVQVPAPVTGLRVDAPPPEPGPGRYDGDRLYDITEVQVHPRLLNPEETNAALREAGADGRVEMRLYVGIDGDAAVTSVSSSPSASASDAAARVVGRMRFAPAVIGGNPVEVVMPITLTFPGDGA